MTNATARPTVRCAATTTSVDSTASTSTANKTSVAAQVVGAVLRFPPLWEAASKNAKNMMVKRAGALDIDWDEEVATLQAAKDWDAALKDATDPEVQRAMPEYYKTSFHAYPEGNLGWDPAHEAWSASTVFPIPRHVCASPIVNYYSSP